MQCRIAACRDDDAAAPPRRRRGGVDDADDDDGGGGDDDADADAASCRFKCYTLEEEGGVKGSNLLHSAIAAPPEASLSYHRAVVGGSGTARAIGASRRGPAAAAGAGSGGSGDRWWEHPKGQASTLKQPPKPQPPTANDATRYASH